MNPTEQCYLAYRHEAQDAAALNKILDDARDMLPIKEYAALDAGINDYCDALEGKAFTAGFRFAVRLLAEGKR